MGKDENYHRAGRAMLPCDVTVAQLFILWMFQPFVLKQKATALRGAHIYCVWNVS
jgi:hypothetical protein